MKESISAWKELKRFFKQTPSEHIELSMLLKFWLVMGTIVFGSLFTIHITDLSPPRYYDLICQEGLLESIGVTKIHKQKVDVLHLKINEQEEAQYVNTYHYQHSDRFFNALLGKPIKVCYYTTVFGRHSYAEIYYQNQRMINEYEEMRLKKIEFNLSFSNLLWNMFIPIPLIKFPN